MCIHRLFAQARGVENAGDSTITEDRRGGNGRRATEGRIQRLDDHFVMAEHGIHEQAAMPGGGTQHDAVPAGARSGVAQSHPAIQHRNHFAPPGHHALAGNLVNRLRADPNGFGDVRQRDGVTLAADVHQQRAKHGDRERQPQRKGGPATRLARDTDLSAQRPNRAGHDIEPYASTGESGDLVRS